jgi:dTMP kinase
VTANGRFIVFEGLDGAGTTTQLRRLGRWLLDQGKNVEETREPSNGPFGAVIRQAIEGRLALHPRALALAFAGDRADHLTNEVNGIEQALSRGAWVLCDRYVLSNLAYQRSGEVDVEWLVDLNRFTLKPDVTVFVDTPPEVCAKRISSRSAHIELYHGQPELERVSRNYRRAVAYQSFVGHLITINGAGDESAVFDELLRELRPWMEEALIQA